MKWNPFRAFDVLDDTFFKVVPSQSLYRPEIRETDEAYAILADMPGMEVAVDLNGNTLTLSGHRDGGDRKYSYSVPRNVDKDTISAVYERGVLQVTLPKKEEARKSEPRTIKVEVK
jgi:HSP20 family protein